ncbi:hypothetical protein FG386_000247, partial [Cryptosporidium ryanae]|uniref:uncharacterized protein n=1 Tax=Cryptosporidium ryanae TaxID=515981 RepID=UPI00351A41C3
RFLPIRRSSLNLFIDKNTDHYSPFGIPFYFKNIEIVIFDALDGKRKKRNSFSFEYFDDSHMNEDKDGEVEADDSAFKEGNVVNIEGESNQVSTSTNDYISCGELKGRRKYLLVARLAKDFEHNSGSVNNEYSVGNNSRGMSGVVNGDSASSEFNITSISNDDDSIASLRSYIFKNKSFDSDKVRIEGSLENINKDNRRLNLGNMNDFNSCNNVFILGNRKSGGAELGEKGSNDNSETSEEEDYFDENNSLYLEQSLISQKRILFELQEADSGQIIANGDIKCSKLVEIAWKSLTSRDGDDENWDFGVSYGRRTPDTDIIQVHDTTSNRTISIHKFVNVSINLYYVEGGQWGELSMSLDRSFWVQYLRHDLSKDIIIDLSEIGVLKRGEKAEGGIEMTKVANKDVSDAEVRNNGSIETESDIIEPRFVNDTPGKIVINGSDTQINWEWRVNATDNGSSGTNANYVPKRIHLHLFDHCTDTFLTSLHSDITVPNNGTYAWSVDIPFISQRSPSRDVYLVMSVSVDEIPSNMKIRGRMMASRQFRCKRSNGVNHTSSEGDLSRANTKNASECIGGSSRSSVFNKQVIVAVSNSFKVIRLTTLSEFEMLYATFCRTFGLEMEVVTYNDLLKYGFHVSKNNLRICENIRRPVPSETNQGGTYCPGQYIISSKALAVRIGDNYDLNKSDKDVENYMFLKSQRKYIDVIENCTLNYSTYWWLSSPDRFLLKNGIILDTSIFLPLTIRIITLFKIDLMMLYMRNLSIKGVVSRFKRRLLVFNGCDSGSSQDLYLGEGDFGGGCRRTINISSGLLVHSNYSTVYRRRSTWRSGKLNSWRIILSFINLRDRKSTKNGNLDYIAGSENYKNPDNFNGETSDNGRLTSKISRELKSVNKSKRRWSNALVSLRLAQLRNSPEKLFSDNGTSRGGYGAIGKGDDNCALDDHRDGGDSNGLLSGSTCRYLELTDSSCTEAGSGTGGDANLTERRRASTGNEGGCMLHGYSIGYGGILVPLYIANIKQRQEMIREMWYKLQFSTFPVVLKTVIYGFQLTLLSIFPITCIILTLLYNYLSTQTISRPHTYISAKYISDIVFNPRWDFFMSISFPVPHLMLVSFLHLLIINITFVSSNTSHSTKTSVVSTSGSPGTGRMSRLHHYWIRILVFLEDIGMFVTLFSTFLTLLAISMFFLWFLLGSLINSDNILPYVVMLLALGFVIVSLWNNFTSSRGIVDKFIAENLQSLISIALGHWFEATNQSYSILSGSAGSDGPDAPGSNGSLLFSDPNDLRSKVSDRLQCEILSNRRVWSKHILDQHKSASGSSNPGNSSSDRRCTEQDYADGSAELRHSTKMSKVHDLRSRSSSFSTLTDCCDMYSLRWEYMKISPARSKRLFKLSKNSEITGVDETMSIYYGMRLATKKDVLLNSGKVNGLLGELDVVLLRDGIKYGSKHGYKVRDFSEKDNNWYKFALVKIPIFPTGSALSDEAKVKLIFDFFDVDRDGYLNKKEMLQWIINLSYDERYFVNGENTKYGDIVEYINSTFSLNVDERNGFVIDDLVAIYSFSPGSVNADYEKIVPVSNYSSGSAEVGGGAHGVSPESNGLEGEKEPDAEDSGSGDGLVLAGNCLDEEEYDDEFGDRIFKLGGSAPDTGLEEGGTHSSLLDRRGYLWADLLSNEDNNIAYRAESRRGSRTTETRVVATDLNDLKLTRVGRTRPNRDVAVGGKGGPRAKGKHNKFQQLREVNVQKLKYIFTFATRNLKTPDIETALKDIHSLAYKVFEAQIALLIPIFGAKNVLSRGSSSGCLREEHVACVRNEVEEEFAGSGVVNADSKRASAPALGSRSLHQASSQLLSSFSSASFVNLGGAGGGLGDGGSYAKGSSNQNLASLLSFPGRSQRRQSSCAGSPGTDGANGGSGAREEDTVKFLQLMRILHNEIRQDIWLLFGHILGKLFNDNRVKNGANHFLDTMYPKLVRRKAARIVNIFYGPSLSELSASIHEYFASAPPKTAAQVVDALKEYRVENQRNVRDTLDIISQSQGNASVQFQVSLITKALYALSLLKDNDVEMLTVDIPWKKSRALIAEEVLILPKNRQGMKLILESIQIVLRRVNSITGANAGGGGVGALGDSASADGGESGAGRRQGRGGGTGSLDLLQSNLMDGRFAEEASDGAMANNEFTEATLEQVIQTIVSRYLWMDSFIFLIRLCGINLSTDRLPSVTYDNSASITNLNYVEERNLEHVKNVFTKLSNGSGFLPVELSDLAVQTLTDKCLNFSGLLVAMNFLGLISDNMFLLGSGNPAEKLSEMGLSGSNVVSVNRDSGAAGRDDGRLPEDLLPGGEAAALATEKTCNYGELLDWTLLSGIRGIPDDMVKDFRSIAMLRCGFIGRSQLHDYIRQHRKLYIAEAAARADAQQPAGRDCFEEMAREGGGGPADFNISFDIFDVALTTLGFSSHKLQSRVLWLLLCLNASLDGTQLFVSARLARDFVIMLYLRPRYKHGGGAGGRGEAETAGGAAGHDNVSGGVGTGQRLGSSYRSSMLDPSFQQCKDLDAQDVECYGGYFTYEMLRRFLVLAKISLPDNGVGAIREVRLTRKKSLGDIFRKRPVAATWSPDSLDGCGGEGGGAAELNGEGVGGGLSRSSSGCGDSPGTEGLRTEREPCYLRIFMDRTGMDPMEGALVSIGTVRRLVPKKLMTGLWPEAIKVLLNIGLHLEKSDLSIMEATSRCLEYSNRYGLIRPGDAVSILAALSKEGLSFDLLCELLNNMRIQLPVRDVKRMFDLMDLNQDKSLDLQELLDGFEVLFGLFLPKLVHVHVGLSYERQSIIIVAVSTALLLFCAFVGIAIKTFEGMRNELSTAVQSVLAIVGAVGLQTGASKDSSEIEERMKERIEDIMGGDIDTSGSQIEGVGDKGCLASGELPRGGGGGGRSSLALTDKGTILRPGLPKYTGLTFNTKTGVIKGTIPLYFDTKKKEYIKRNTISDLNKYLRIISNSGGAALPGGGSSRLLLRKASNIGPTSGNGKSSRVAIFRRLSSSAGGSNDARCGAECEDDAEGAQAGPSGRIDSDLSCGGGDECLFDLCGGADRENRDNTNALLSHNNQFIHMNKQIFNVYCTIGELNEKIVYKTRVTFQILPGPRK